MNQIQSDPIKVDLGWQGIFMLLEETIGALVMYLSYSSYVVQIWFRGSLHILCHTELIFVHKMLSLEPLHSYLVSVICAFCIIYCLPSKEHV